MLPTNINRDIKLKWTLAGQTLHNASLVWFLGRMMTPLGLDGLDRHPFQTHGNPRLTLSTPPLSV